MAIDHTLRYDYTDPVFVEPLTIRLTPATNAWQRCESHDLSVDPAPRGITPHLDAGNHTAHTLWFEEMQTGLEIRARSVVRTLCENPFNFILTDPAAMTAPVRYDSVVGQALAPHRRKPDPCERLESLVDAARRESENCTLEFLFMLCARIHGQIECVVRPEGDPWPAGWTLNRGSGSCRDLAVVFIEGARRVGLAARFVSGYKLELDQAEPNAELHAWAEVFLPGAGWRGYDPSLGLAVSDRHIVLAAAHTPELAAPIHGAFRGTGIQAAMTARVAIEPLRADESAV
jgi:transglutaminase-like putative cysteine protease